MNSAAGFALCLLSLAPWAGAADVAVGGAGRGGPMVVVSPNFSASLQLQRGADIPGFQAITDNILRLPGGAELKGIGASWFGLRDSDQSIPALPQSAVVAGEALKTLSAPMRSAAFAPENAAGLVPDMVRAAPPASDSAAPAMKRMDREIAERTARLRAPLDAVSRTGANAPSASELRRLGEEIWDMAAAASRGSDERAGGSVGAASSLGGRSDFGSSASEPGAGSRDALRGGISRSGGAAGVRDEGFGATPAADDGRREPSRFADRSSLFMARGSRPSRAVALVTMSVVGQSLLLSEAGLMSDAARAGAVAISRRLRPEEAARAAALGGARRGFGYDRSRHPLQEAVSWGAALAAAGPSSVLPRLTGADSLGAGVLGVRSVRGYNVPRALKAVDAWSWVALLPLMLLGLAVLPEYR